MIKFYGLEYTYYDHPGKYSLVLYSAGCNLKCYGCHNSVLAGWKYQDVSKENIVNVNTKDYAQVISDEELKMSVQCDILDMIIVCGGEFLIHDIENIKETIEYIKFLNPNVLIRIDTNGTYPQKVEQLSNWGKIDGFALDIKGPYWNEKYHETINKVIGIGETQAKILYPKMTESLNIVKHHEFTVYRTVVYPIIKDDNYFREIKTYVNQNLGKPHSFNNYVNLHY